MVLKGVRVLELTTGLAGSLAGLVLADLGAEVVKIEPPEGDASRRAGPGSLPAMSAFFAAYHLGKKSVALNLDQPASRAAFHALVKTADVVLEDLAPDTAARWEVDYACLARIKPDLVYGSVSGYGRAGPWRCRESCEAFAQAQFGMMDSNRRDGEPVQTGFPVTETGAGIQAAFAVVVALMHRERTGRGQCVEATLMHAQMAFAGHLATLFDFAPPPDREERGPPAFQLAPYQAFRAADGWVVVATSNERQWERICSHPLFASLREEPRFRTMRQRVLHRVPLAEAFEARFRDKTGREVEELFEALDIPCSRVLPLGAVWANDFFSRATLDCVEVPGYGPLAVPKCPFSLGALTGSKRRPPPSLGEHRFEILAPLGYTREAINALGR